MVETSWPRGEVRWHLELQARPDRIRPQLFPAEPPNLFDMSVESAPSVTFNGWVEHRGERFPVVRAPGMISQYWGRRLPPEWWWISANQFQDADLSVECTALRSHVLGRSILAPLGYLYYRNGSRSRLLICPPGRMKVVGTPDSFEVRATSLGGAQIALKAAGRAYASLGEGIVNTLIGDLEFWESGRLIAQAWGTAALERRTPSRDASA